MVNPSASQARGPRFESRREHSSFSWKSPDFVPVAPRVAFSGMGQAKIGNNLYIYLFISPTDPSTLLPTRLLPALPPTDTPPITLPRLYFGQLLMAELCRRNNRVCRTNMHQRICCCTNAVRLFFARYLVACYTDSFLRT